MANSEHPYPLDQVPWSKQCTLELRTSPSPRWQRVRARLNEADVQPEDVALVYFGPDEATSAWGLIVTRDDRIFELLLEFDSVKTMDETSYVDFWRELDITTLRGIYAQGLALGRDLLRDDNVK